MDKIVNANIHDVICVLAQPLITTLPISLCIYYFGRQRGLLWLRGEWLLSYFPWLFTMLFFCIERDETYLGWGIFFGVLSGFILLPRLLVPARSHGHRLCLALLPVVIGTLICLAGASIVCPFYRE